MNNMSDVPAPLSIPVGFLIELSETIDRQDVIVACARWVRLVLECERLSIMLPCDDDRLERILVEDNQIVQTGEKTPLSGTNLGELFRQKRPALQPDLASIDAPDSQHAVSLGYVSAVVSPIMFGGDCLGLLVAAFKVSRERLEEDLLLLETMGRCLASYMLLHDKLFELSEHALKDPLTKVHNRRSFNLLAEAALERWHETNETFSLLICDLDRFKRLNDTYGHDFGDEVLCAVADAMKDVARQSDQVIRLGGEEFCMLMSDTDRDSAWHQAQAVRKAVEDLALQCADERVAVTTSVGVATMMPGVASVRELTIAADAVLYEAKESGRNRVVQAV